MIRSKRVKLLMFLIKVVDGLLDEREDRKKRKQPKK